MEVSLGLSGAAAHLQSMSVYPGGHVAVEVPFGMFALAGPCTIMGRAVNRVSLRTC